MANIKKIVSELYERPSILTLLVIEVKPEIYVENTWQIPKSEKEGRREIKK